MFLATSSRRPRRSVNIFPTSAVTYPEEGRREADLGLRGDLSLSPLADLSRSSATIFARSRSTTRTSNKPSGFPFGTRRLFILLCYCDCCGRIAASILPNESDCRSRPPMCRRYRSSSSARVFSGSPLQNFPSARVLCSLLSMCARRREVPSVPFPFLSSSLLSSLTPLVREKEKDYHSTTTSVCQTTRLPKRRERRTTAATDSVVVSLGVVVSRRCRCFLLYRSVAVAADSRRRRLVLSARELFRGVGFLGERAARDAIVLPVPVPTADCVPAPRPPDHLACRRRGGPPGRALSVVARSVVPRRGDVTGDFRANPIAGSYRSIAVHLFHAPKLPRCWIQGSSCFRGSRCRQMTCSKCIDQLRSDESRKRSSEVAHALVNVRLEYLLEFS